MAKKPVKRKPVIITEHEIRKGVVLQAVEHLHADTSVSRETTIDSLQEVVDKAEALIRMVQDDIDGEVQQ